MYIIKVLSKLVNNWVRDVTFVKSHGGEMYEQATILVGGSWRMGKISMFASVRVHNL